MEIPYFENNIEGRFEKLGKLLGNALEFLTVRNLKLGTQPFGHLSRLRNLNLFMCDLAQVTSDSFVENLAPRLECLQVYAPKNYSHISFERLNRLKWLRASKLDDSTLEFLISHLSTDLCVLELVSSLNETLNISRILGNLHHAHLRALHLVDNEFGHFESKWLAGLPSLRHLKLGANLIKSLELTDDCLVQLESLSLDHNKLECSQLDGAFVRLDNLESLDLTHNANLRLGPHVFVGLSRGRLKYLYLACVNRKKYFSRLDRDLFVDVTSSSNNRLLGNLTVLDLKRNHLTSLDPAVFECMPQLERLDLSENQLRKLHDVASFASLGHSLVFLDLSLNELESIADGVFASLRRLETLSLYFNLIGEVTARSFDGLKSLRKLCLRENCLQTVNSLVFAHMRSLNEVDLSGMNIPEINRNELRQFYSARVNFLF